MESRNDLHSTDTLRADDELNIPYYLYQYRDSQPVFSQIEEEMTQLNDFCYFCINSLDTHVQNLHNKLFLYGTKKLRAVDVDGEDVTHDFAWGLREFEIPLWTGMQEFIVRAMCFVMLSAFVEKSLKDLIEYLNPEDTPKCSRRPKEGEIAFLLRCLKEACKIEFEEPAESYAVRERCRRIRNKFAHGSWEKIKEEVAGQSLLEAFMAVTALFYTLDEATSNLQSIR